MEVYTSSEAPHIDMIVAIWLMERDQPGAQKSDDYDVERDALDIKRQKLAT
eukprot:m.1121816 g.1121816  ORF g.1121816 m.1121816 type:complete len:51 (+) comp24400_c0_seq8:3533-3685(+)